MSSTKGLILVVDDNKENLRVVSGFLKGRGYQIALSLNAENAYQILETHHIDLILLDVMMPEEDGYTFCRRINQEGRFKEIPVIFLTALTESEDLVAGFNAGGVDYITKPFRKDELFARVKSHVELAQAKREIIAQAEHIRKINHTRDLMYSIISHDIRSPFASISMMVSMLAEGYLDPGTEEFDEIIQNLNNSTKETYNLLDNLLQWTRTQTGNIESNPELLNLEEIIQNNISLVAKRAELKGITTEATIQSGLSAYADSNMVSGVIRNLLSNSVKFTDEGGSVSIKGATDGDRAMIEVKDSGIGMNQEQLSKLFHKDNFSTTPGTQNEKGSGLGLHLVKDFTERNGGEIIVESEPGKGTTFKLWFLTTPA
jgi:two-component system, sensor histidine kinase and response regulator